MKVDFLAKFDKDVDNILDKSILEDIADVIETVELAENITELKNIKKLVGFKNAYRIKIGKYRIGFFFENQTVEFARVVHRKDIYKIFP
ncbi:mRNA-degrading endonuclease RelE of RelBE toxin-antitoxin system [Arcicella aurantiaca]|uniref:mRNA-degrading endonuclease RelE of RelBE toxin-antitoxin system n=1 Tax=Arcicella aurantiaca TaxID=591202 RepID=A0A316EF46_9BACT|nr:type II toxin-antitoxin system RelE/ParE family toxin [Arcicella aurantiaca]PWK28312.1 mRNA-degrading endonuclease RelE of RelBE toxin-antitoxin system [Arcicella aurantiaca]